ncbi:MAG: hypothetical protein MRZ79_25530 [Bacteroidia bacterium]|nr:hypothetical protein [Bacteroidia bacterium]
MEPLENQLLASWQRHQRINAYFLDHMQESYLLDSLEGGDRNIGQLFAHLHEVRRMWLQVAAPDLWEQTSALDKKRLSYRNYLNDQLEESGHAIEALLKRSMDTGKIKGFKAGLVNFMAYLISHESHHRGQAIIILRINGREVSEALAYGIWDWGKR